MFRNKKQLIRLILFILVVIIAMGSFTIGVIQYLHRDSGYYDVEYSAQTKPTLFESGVHLRYYAEGGSAQIRTEVREVQSAFSDALLWIYQQLDEKHTYEGVTNPASLNAAPGEWIEISKELEAVLREALKYTQAGEGYSLFSGPLHREWEILRYLDEPGDFDPLNSPEERDILDRLTAFISQPDTFSLEIEDGKARLTVSEAYQSWAEEAEIAAPILDLNLVKDAYLLQYTARSLWERGYTAGYLYTDSGLSILLNPTGETAYQIPGCLDGEAVAAGEISLPSPSAFCQFTACPLKDEKYGYYAVEQNGNTVYRHPWIDVLSGDTRQVLMTAALGGRMEQLPELTYQMIRLTCCPDQAVVDDALNALPENVFGAYTLIAEKDPMLYVRSNGTAISLASGFAVIFIADR